MRSRELRDAFLAGILMYCGGLPLENQHDQVSFLLQHRGYLTAVIVMAPHDFPRRPPTITMLSPYHESNGAPTELSESNITLARDLKNPHDARDYARRVFGYIENVLAPRFATTDALYYD